VGACNVGTAESATSANGLSAREYQCLPVFLISEVVEVGDDKSCCKPAQLEMGWGEGTSQSDCGSG
jgi:hypothetical protein